MTKEEVLERLVGAYTAYFNIRRDTELNGLPVAMDAEYHVRNEQYVLSREAKLWEAENDEYAFVVVLDSEGRQQVIYKHAISTIAPVRPVDLTEEPSR